MLGAQHVTSHRACSSKRATHPQGAQDKAQREGYGKRFSNHGINALRFKVPATKHQKDVLLLFLSGSITKPFVVSAQTMPCQQGIAGVDYNKAGFVSGKRKIFSFGF